jgi:hypothetical protein
MRKSSVIIIFPIAAIFLLAVSCGSNSMMMSTRQLQSVAVSPSSAVMATSSNGMVQFTAMETYTMAPMTANLRVRWSLGSPFSTPAPTGVSIDANGVAQCSGFNGMIMVEATSPMDPNMPVSQMSMNTMNVTGMAPLTCP